MAVSVRNDAEWDVFRNKIGLQEDPIFSTMESRVAHGQELADVIEQCFAGYTSKEVEAMFDGTGVPVSSMMGIVEALENPQLLARNMVIEVQDPMIGPLKLVGNPIILSQEKPVTDIPSPLLGEHTDEILRSLGYGDEQIKDLHECGAV